MLSAIITVFFVLYVVVTVYIIWNLLKKTETQELALMSMYEQVSVVLRDMRLLDERQMFESDDEVGTVFTELKETIETYKNEI